MADADENEIGIQKYQAIIWKDGYFSGARVDIYATSLSEAKMKLEYEYGKETVFDLHNEDEANSVR